MSEVRTMRDRLRGLFEKFTITRTDGKSAPGEKHEKCRYFVLDLDHDPYAHIALEAYEKACIDEYPKLALDCLKLRRATEFASDELFQKLAAIRREGKR